jgi:hypothetical protein
MVLPDKILVRKKYFFIIGIALISLAMHFNHFSKELVGIHVWRQTQTQIVINNFYQEDFNILNPRINEREDRDGIFRMEFPLMQWLIALLYKILGSHIIITRISMFIVGLFSVAGMYKLLKNISGNDSIGLIAAWTFNFSPSFYFYTINPLPDNLALCCGIWSLAFFFIWTRQKKISLLFISGFFLSAAALCKLPFILFYTLPFTYFIINAVKNKELKKNTINLFAVSLFLIFPLSWYASVVPQWHGNGVVSGIADNHFSFMVIMDYLLFNFESTLPELLINYGSVVFFIAGFYFLIKLKLYKKELFPVIVICCLSIVAYFLFEINMIAKVHDYYLFPFYPGIFILVSYGAYYLLKSGGRGIQYFVMACLLILPLTAYIRMHGRWNLEKPGFNKDLLIYKEELRNAVPDNALCIMGNEDSHFVYSYYVNKKGWIFNEDDLDAEKMKQIINRGASYMYSDSRKTDEGGELKPYLDSLIMEKGSIRVYRLKTNIK